MTVRLDKKERVAHLVMDAPPVNVLDIALLEELDGALASCAADESLSAVLLSGEGKCFSAGASIADHKPEKAERMLHALGAACRSLAALPVPAIALVHGSCLGGAMELVAFADFVVADPGATFGQPEIRLAFFPPLACGKLPRLVGHQNAAWLALTGETIGAERALGMGLVQQILPRDQWGEIEKRFKNLSRPVLRLAKEALLRSTPPDRPDDHRELEELFLERLYRLEDVAEGIRSFEEKRRPDWKHR